MSRPDRLDRTIAKTRRPIVRRDYCHQRQQTDGSRDEIPPRLGMTRKGTISLKKSFIAVSAGAPLLALGVAAAPAAWAAHTEVHGATVSINGETKHQGTASAFAQASPPGTPPNVAVAVGSSSLDPSSAVVFAPGSGNKAIAIKGGSALVENGSNNTAVATGNNAAIIHGVSGVHCHNGGIC
ncbi:MAG TPA: hypothetical protein VHT50_09860 [Mycobacterium sp.]|jgi:hypothetical protein|nr:hypothetical protein [Mycobacterium sp.]